MRESPSMENANFVLEIKEPLDSFPAQRHRSAGEYAANSANSRDADCAMQNSALKMAEDHSTTCDSQSQYPNECQSSFDSSAYENETRTSHSGLQSPSNLPDQLSINKRSPPRSDIPSLREDGIP